MPNDYHFSPEELFDIKEALSYDKDSGIFTWRYRISTKVPAGSRAGSPTSWGYLRLCWKKKRFSAHRLAWLFMNGEWPDGQIDHIDGDKKNNAIKNLRVVTPSTNQLLNKNPRSGNKTGFLGVTRSRGLYVATLSGQFLGHFQSAEAAHIKYLSAKQELLEATRAITGAPNGKPTESPSVKSPNESGSTMCIVRW